MLFSLSLISFVPFQDCRFTIHVLQLKNKEAEIHFLCYSFSDQTKTKQEREYFRMGSITQDIRFRLSLIKYAEKHGVTKAALKYKTNRQYIYRWKNRYDGSWDYITSIKTFSTRSIEQIFTSNYLPL